MTEIRPCSVSVCLVPVESVNAVRYKRIRSISCGKQKILAIVESMYKSDKYFNLK
jgi:hypothetical protein